MTSSGYHFKRRTGTSCNGTEEEFHDKERRGKEKEVEYDVTSKGLAASKPITHMAI